MDIKELIGGGFKFKKQLGQNFISDKNLLKAIVFDSGITKEDTVLEIGAGAGTLTEILAQNAKKVISFEVDTDLKEILNRRMTENSNLSVYFADILKMSDEEIREKVPEPFKVVANLPYYVTTPMIMRFVESGLSVINMTLMMQKEVADRLTAKCDTKEYGAITVALEAVADTKITRTIDRRLFYPTPNVDSALIKIDFNKNKYNFENFSVFKKTVKSAFLMRRKTLANNLISVFPINKQIAEKLIISAGFNPSIRGEALSCSQLIKLSDLIARELSE